MGHVERIALTLLLSLGCCVDERLLDIPFLFLLWFLVRRSGGRSLCSLRREFGLSLKAFRLLLLGTFRVGVADVVGIDVCHG